MKTHSIFKLKSLFSLVLIVAALASCNKDDDAFEGPTTSNDNIVAIPFFVETADGQLPSDPSDLLYEIRKQEPVIAPDGHHVTWGEFSAIQGSASVKCTEKGTQAVINVSGLIPNGVYTIWNVTVKAPGFDPSKADFNITGIGAAGDGNGQDNVITASPSGTISITTKSLGGSLSMFGEIGDCPISDEFEWHLVGTYHIDGKTYGRDLGPDGTVAEQFGFIFQNPN